MGWMFWQWVEKLEFQDSVLFQGLHLFWYGFYKWMPFQMPIISQNVLDAFFSFFLFHGTSTSEVTLYLTRPKELPWPRRGTRDRLLNLCEVLRGLAYDQRKGKSFIVWGGDSWLAWILHRLIGMWSGTQNWGKYNGDEVLLFYFIDPRKLKDKTELGT